MLKKHYVYKGIKWSVEALAEHFGTEPAAVPAKLAGLSKARTVGQLPTVAEAREMTAKFRKPAGPAAAGEAPKATGPKPLRVRMEFADGEVITFGNAKEASLYFGTTKSAVFRALKLGKWKNRSVVKAERVL